MKSWNFEEEKKKLQEELKVARQKNELAELREQISEEKGKNGFINKIKELFGR